MPTFERTVEIAASPQTVWGIVANPVYAPKLFPYLVLITADPPGIAQVGQKTSATLKIRGRKVHATMEVTEVVPNKKLVHMQLPGGFMKNFLSTVILEPSRKGTRLTSRAEFEASVGYLGKSLGGDTNSAIEKNLRASGDNVKELAELKEIPPQPA